MNEFDFKPLIKQINSRLQSYGIKNQYLFAYSNLESLAEQELAINMYSFLILGKRPLLIKSHNCYLVLNYYFRYELKQIDIANMCLLMAYIISDTTECSDAILNLPNGKLILESIKYIYYSQEIFNFTERIFYDILEKINEIYHS